MTQKNDLLMDIPDAPPKSEWMTVDGCFDDIINSVEKIYGHNKKKKKPILVV